MSQYPTDLAARVQAMGYPHSDCALRAHLESLRGKVKGDFPEASYARPFFREGGDLALYSSF